METKKVNKEKVIKPKSTITFRDVCISDMTNDELIYCIERLAQNKNLWGELGKVNDS